ncbi:MAG: helix-turn-helix domain-containing protein, partial [Luteimonas sp.]
MLLRAQTPKQLASVLRGQRRASKLTQKQAAALVGLLPKTISAFESEPGRGSVDSLFKLLSALGLELVLQSKTNTPPATSLSEWSPMPRPRKSRQLAVWMNAERVG